MMGLFENLSDYSYPDHQITDAGIAFKTTSDLLYGKAFDPVKTAEMQLPEGIKGAAFLDEEGKHIYVLWARTSQDNDETASATYSFTQGFGLEEVAIAQWNFGLTRDTVKVDPQQINLTGAPMFIAEEIQGGQPVDVTDEALKSSLNLEIFPNPFRETVQISLKIVEHQVISIDLYSSKGQKIDQLLETSNLSAGLHHFSFVLESLPPGVYWISVSSEYGKLNRKLIAN